MADKKGRGFAAMDAAKQREIASKGGRAAHAKGTAHRFTRDEARQAGRKGGQVAHLKGTAHEFTSEEARVAGRKGGHATRGRAAASRTRPGSNELADRPAPASVSINNGAQAAADPDGAAMPNGADNRPAAEPKPPQPAGFSDDR